MRRESLVMFAAMIAATTCGSGCQKGHAGTSNCADSSSSPSAAGSNSAAPIVKGTQLGEADSGFPVDDPSVAQINAEFMKSHPGWRDWTGDYEGSSCAETHPNEHGDQIGLAGIITACTSFTIHIENDLAEIREGGFQMLRRYPFFATVEAQTDHACFNFDRDAEEKPLAIEKKRGDRFGCLYETDAGLIGDGGFAVFNRRPTFSRQKGPSPWPR